MSLRRALQSSRTAIPPEASSRQAASIEDRPWSRRKWPREQLRAHWPHLTIQQVELLKEVFQLFDTEDKGYFTKDDLFFVMEAMGGSPTPQELDAVMYELDSNGDSVVDFPEFLTKFLTATDEKELLSVFHHLAIHEGEGNDDRVLTLTAVERSFQYVGERLTDEDKKYLEVIFRGADKDGNGRLDIKEFTAYLEKMDDELFMGQAGALGNLLAAANVSGSTKGFRCGRLGGGSAGAGASQHRSNGGVDNGDGGGGAGGSSAVVSAGTDAEVAAAMLTNGQILAMATRALSSRVGGTGLPEDVESTTSNQSPLRNSFLSKLRRRHRRSSINSSTIAAIAEQLASMGVASGGSAVRVGNMSSAACLAATGLLQQDVSEGRRRVSSAHMAMHSQLATPTGAVPPGPAGVPHFLVEASSMPALRLVSSTGQIGGFLCPEDQSPRLVPATASVALSRGESFGDSVATGSGVGSDSVAAAVGGLPHYHRKQHPIRPPTSATSMLTGFGSITNGASTGSVMECQGYNAHPPQHHDSYVHPHPKSYNTQQQSAFHQMRSHSMSAVGSLAMSVQALMPMPMPATLRDSDEAPSSSASPFPSPRISTGGGGTGSGGYTGRPGIGIRSPTAAWQKASVIQEAPEEGDSTYGGMCTTSVAETSVVDSRQQHLPQPRFDHRVEFPVRTSAPTRFGPLGSFPTRSTQQPEIGLTGSGGASCGVSGADAADATNNMNVDCRGGRDTGLCNPPRPMRLGSGGDGRLGQRIGVIVAAMFSRQRSLGPGGATSAAQVVAGPHGAPLSSGVESVRGQPPSHSHIPVSQPSAEHLNDENERKTGPPGSWGFAASARAAMGWLRRARSFGTNRTRAASSSGVGGGPETVSGGIASRSSRTRVLSLQPAAAAVGATAAAAGAKAPTGTGRLTTRCRLTVEVPGSDSPVTSPLISPAELAPSSYFGSSAVASSTLSPAAESGPSPVTSPAAAAPPLAAIASASGSGVGGPTSPPSAVFAGSEASASLEQSDSGQVRFATCRPLPSPARQARAPHNSPDQAAHIAAMQPYFRPPGAPQSHASASSASPSPLQQRISNRHQPFLQDMSPRMHPSEPGLTRPAAQSAYLVSGAVPARMPGSGLGNPSPPRSLHRSGSTGASSRLAVSSVRDSKLAMPLHLHRHLSLKLHHNHNQHQHHHHVQLPLPPPAPLHQLSQQGLRQLNTYGPNAPVPSPQSPHGGLPHGSTHCQEMPPPQPPPMAPPPLGPPLPMQHRYQSSLERGDGVRLLSPFGLQQVQALCISGTGSIFPNAGGSATPMPSASAASTSAMVAGPVPGSPWATMWASAQSLQVGALPGGSRAGRCDGGLGERHVWSDGRRGGLPAAAPPGQLSREACDPRTEVSPPSRRSFEKPMYRVRARGHPQQHQQQEEEEEEKEEDQQLLQEASLHSPELSWRSVNQK